MTTDVMEPRGGAMVESDFLTQLAAVIRAEDSYGQWDDKSDADIMAEFIVTKEERREIPIIGDPDPDVMWRVGKFYDAVGLLIEKRSGCMASQMQKMSHEGFGRVVLIAGKLVVVSKHLRDIHRFGFVSWEKLAEAGDKLVASAVEAIDAYPDAARA
ncbi:NifX-associated nitrogen fixation protein [Salipiger abyssi]|uniref:NifX-associated nitrogen fixation protein n=1 Tax=Salipiger abyssi TaxID=1250539 RepID=UPI001A8E8DC0|nr:NifX-associated nitrogen fixation protein [Salipiger abyssi]MBN9887941.1 NifX-associated nitrogen fixation protein [Salipiger abyssi]